MCIGLFPTKLKLVILCGLAVVRNIGLPFIDVQKDVLQRKILQCQLLILPLD